MPPDASALNRPLTGPDGQWAAAAQGSEIVKFSTFHHKKSDTDISTTVRFCRSHGLSHLHNELAKFLITPDGIYCDIVIGLPEVYCGRVQAVLSCLEFYLEDADLFGEFFVSLGDEGLNERVLSFCSIIPDYLIPDPYFIHTQGYASERLDFLQAPIWEERRNCAYWRGTDTGVWRYREPSFAPRVAVCQLSRIHPSLINAAITRIEPRANSDELKLFYENNHILATEEPQNEIMKYKYQIDIDGNTSTWSGFFLKLLSGSPVLKVTSEYNWRQWYYRKIVEGRHFIPIKPDLSDLIQKLQWLEQNPKEAKFIGNAGAEFARSITIENSLHEAARAISNLINLNSRINSFDFE